MIQGYWGGLMGPGPYSGHRACEMRLCTPVPGRSAVPVLKEHSSSECIVWGLFT